MGEVVFGVSGPAMAVEIYNSCLDWGINSQPCDAAPQRTQGVPVQP